MLTTMTVINDKEVRGPLVRVSTVLASYVDWTFVLRSVAKHHNYLQKTFYCPFVVIRIKVIKPSI